MESEAGPTEGEFRGAGGKVRKPSSRKPLATPYARPPQAEHSRRRWLSKLVDPACRLISDGATRMFPSFFSKSDSASDTDTQDEIGIQQTVGQNHADNDPGRFSDPKISNSNDKAGPSLVTSKLEGGSNFNVTKEDDKVKEFENNGLSQIEKLVKNATFSRDQANRLMEILSSRVMELPKFARGPESTNPIAEENVTHLVSTPDFPNITDELKLEFSNGPTKGPATAFLHSNIFDEIGASPADIARAYMSSRALEAGSGSKGKNGVCENTTIFGDESAIKPKFRSPMHVTSTCWPGAVVKYAYATPESQKGSYGFRNFPRTPYSRTILSSSKTRLSHAMDDDHVLTASVQQNQTHIHGQKRSINKELDGGYGSVGPIRRIRHRSKLQSPWRGSRFVKTSIDGPSQMENSRTLEGVDPVATKSMEFRELGLGMSFYSSDDKPLVSEIHTPPVHPHTSLMARKILEHIDRNLPTPKEKSAELKLAINWKQPESSGVDTNVSFNKKNLLVPFKDSDPQKCCGPIGEKNPLRKDEGQVPFNGNNEPKNIKASNGISNGFLSTNLNPQSSVSVISDDALKSKDTARACDVPFKFTTRDVPMPVHDLKSVGNEKMEQSNSSSVKAVLPSISISKPQSKWASTSDSGSGFTFPISSSTSVVSEPPTPSIMPTSSIGHVNQSKEDLQTPPYSFGLKSPTAALVFSFPSTSTTASPDEECDIKFCFGSDQNSRISFSSFDKNAVCY